MASFVLVVDDEAIQQLALNDGRIMIGRSNKAEIRIADETVSARHAVIDGVRNEENGDIDYFIQDLSSANGTYVSGRRVRRKRLKDGDIVKVGWNTFKFLG